jgi:hypothetical protein
MIFPRIVSILNQKSYLIGTRPFELNIVGVRSRETKANRFDDEIHVFYKTEGGKNWNYHIFKATTDPGTFWLENPMHPQGTAILKAGQYFDAYKIGLHQGKYKALVQKSPVTVIRDYNRNAVLDIKNGQEYTGNFGINIHYAVSAGSVDRDSAGCQVLENKKDHDLLMQLAEKHRQLYGNSFTYTLIDFRAVRREFYRRFAIGAATVGAAFMSYIGFNKQGDADYSD